MHAIYGFVDFCKIISLAFSTGTEQCMIVPVQPWVFIH